MKLTVEINARVVLRWLLGAVFVWAAISKLANPQDFYTHLVAYQLPLPDELLRLTAITLPWLEMFCGLLLLTRLWLRPTLLWTVILCVIFVLATGQAWARGLEISCGCLNFDFLGINGGAKSATAMLLQSVGFAFVRAMLLTATGVYLLRRDAAS